MKNAAHKWLSYLLASAFFMVWAPISASAVDLVLSGGEDPSTPYSVDDYVDISINKDLRYPHDSIFAGQRSPLTLTNLKEGDVITIAAVDYFGHCRGLSALYLHNIECGTSLRIFKGRDDGCGDYPAGETFVTVPYTVTSELAACTDINVKRMRCGRSPTIKLLDTAGHAIKQNSSDFPPEVITKTVHDGEKVLFELKEARKKKFSVQAEGWVGPAGGPDLFRLYGPMTITFPAHSTRTEEVFRGSDVHYPRATGKVEEIQWKFKKNGRL